MCTPMWKREGGGGGGGREGRGRTSICAFGSVTARDAWRRGSALYCETERDGFRIQIALPSASQGFSSVSAPSVFCCFELVQSKQIYCHNTPECYRVCVCVCDCVCLSHTCMYIQPPGMCGRRAAR